MNIKLTILCENTVEKASPFGLLGEYGFSCLIETDQGNYLFDTGGGLTISNNAERLGIDLKQLNAIILSHGHLDHTGGLKQVLEQTGPINVHAHPDLFSTRFSSHGAVPRDISIPWNRQDLESYGAIFHLSTAPVHLSQNIVLSGCVPKTNPFEGGDDKLTVPSATQCTRHDPLEDDLSVFIQTGQGLVVLLGCAHSGLMNIMDHAQKVTGEQRIHAIIGGTHLMVGNAAQLQATMDRIAREEVAHIGASHCTGRQAMLALSTRFKERCFSATVGTTLQIQSNAITS